MKFYRAVKDGQNIYKPSTLRGANTMRHTGRGIYVFVVDGESAIRCYSATDLDDDCEEKETVTLDLISERFDVPKCHWREIEVDEFDTIQFGFGQYANFKSDYLEDYIYIPEAYIEFSEF